MKKMKTIILEIEDSAYEHFIGIIKICSWAKIRKELTEEEIRKDLDRKLVLYRDLDT